MENLAFGNEWGDEADGVDVILDRRSFSPS
jgi:hypothetical protein